MKTLLILSEQAMLMCNGLDFNLEEGSPSGKWGPGCGGLGTFIQRLRAVLTQHF